MNHNQRATKLFGRTFLLGWGLALLGAYFALTVFLRLISYYSRRDDPDIPTSESMRWCYECSGWEWVLGPDWSLAVGVLSLIAIAIGIFWIITKSRNSQLVVNE